MLEQHPAYFEVSDPRDHGALHDCTSFIIFDVAHPARLLKCNVFGETLLLKVPNSVIVRVGEEMLYWRRGFDVVLEVGHEMCAVPFDLLVGGYGAEDNFCKFSAVEWTVRDASAIMIREHAMLCNW